MRRYLAIQQDRRHSGAEELLVAADQPSAHGGVHRVRLRAAVPRRLYGNGWMDRGGHAQGSRGHRRRTRDLSRDSPQTISRREFRQTVDPSPGPLTPETPSPNARPPPTPPPPPQSGPNSAARRP